MRKKLLSFVLCLCAGMSLHASELNIYASGLNATQSAGVTTIDYVLNAPATALNVKLYDGSTLIATIPVTGAANLTKGSHSGVVITLPNLNGTFTWALEASAAAHNEDLEIGIATVAIGNAQGSDTDQPDLDFSYGMTLEDNPESPYFGTIFIVDSKGTGKVLTTTPLFSSLETLVSGLWSSSSKFSPLRIAIGEDGLLYVTDWSDQSPNLYAINPSDGTYSPIFGGTHSGSGIMVNGSDEQIHGSISGCCVVGTGSTRTLYTLDEDVMPNSKKGILAYEIKSLATPWTDTYSKNMFVNSDTKLANHNANIFFDGHAGFWVSQHREIDSNEFPALMHVSASKEVDWNTTGEVTSGSKYTFGALFVSHDKSLVATSCNGRVKFWSPTFSGNTLSSVSLSQTVNTDVTNNYNVVVDPAKNVYLIGKNKMWAYASATANNTCETPAKAANTITATASPVERSVTSGNWGTVCFPHEVTAANRSGATFFSIAGKRTSDGTASGTPTSIVLTEVPAANDLTAGEPYIFQATASSLTATFTGTAEPAGNANGLIGTYVTMDVEAGKYLLSSGQVVKAGTGCSIAANRAYIDMDEVPVYAPTPAPGRIVDMPLAPDNATQLTSTNQTAEASIFILNGQLYIRRNGITYDALGRIVK